MSLFWIFVVGIIAWNIYKAYKKSQDQQILDEWQAGRSEVDEESVDELSLRRTRRVGGISEGQTVEWADTEEEQHIVVPSVQETVTPLHETLTELHESQHDIVHPSTRTRAEEPKPERAQKSSLQLLTKQNLMQAVVLSEVLGEPRAKRPWRPNRKR